MRAVNSILAFSNVYNQDVLIITQTMRDYDNETEVIETTKEEFLNEMRSWLANEDEDEDQFFKDYVNGLLEADDIKIDSIVILRDRKIFKMDLEDIYEE